jgi:outer membrane lipoprotein-sorting protein
MLRLRVFALTGCVLVLGTFLVRGQDADLKAILVKSIEAHGGAKNLDKYTAATSKFKGTIELMGASRAITGETSFQKPDKFKNVMNIDFNGKGIDVISVYNGKKMWVWNSVVAKTTELDDEKLLKGVREQLQTEGASGLAEFIKAPYELSAIGEVKVKGKDAVGIRVSKKGQPDISLFIDKKSHLIVKTEMRTYDAESKQEVTQEKFIIGYQEKNGMKVPQRVEILKDGKAFMDIEILESQPFEKLDASVFAKP